MVSLPSVLLLIETYLCRVPFPLSLPDDSELIFANHFAFWRV